MNQPKTPLIEAAEFFETLARQIRHTAEFMAKELGEAQLLVEAQKYERWAVACRERNHGKEKQDR